MFEGYWKCADLSVVFSSYICEGLVRMKLFIELDDEESSKEYC